MVAPEAYLRIGELSRRVGVPPELLRAWESRYGLLAPSRSAGGFRLYSDEDERRVRSMQAHLEGGLSAAEAARRVLQEPGRDGGGLPAAATEGVYETARSELGRALESYDDTEANRVLDRLFAGFSAETVLQEVVLPYLAELGDRWSRGEVDVAQEHFASNVIRGRLLGLARGWGQGSGPRALLACAPGELHDLALIVFGLALRARGWRIAYLGTDTPVETLGDAAQRLEPRLVVVSASVPEALRAAAPDLRRLGRQWPLALGGQGALAEDAARIGVLHLGGDPFDEAERLARGA